MNKIKEKIIDIIEQIKSWNWEVIRNILIYCLLIWGYYALCEMNCTKKGGEWNRDTKNCEWHLKK